MALFRRYLRTMEERIEKMRPERFQDKMEAKAKIVQIQQLVMEAIGLYCRTALKMFTLLLQVLLLRPRKLVSKHSTIIMKCFTNYSMGRKMQLGLRHKKSMPRALILITSKQRKKCPYGSFQLYVCIQVYYNYYQTHI